MSLPNLSGSNIQDTFQRVLHTDGASIFDGTGSTVLSGTELTSLQAIGSSNISATEWAEIAKIGSADISTNEWSYVATMQPVSTTSTPTFQNVMVLQEDTPGFANATQLCGMGFAEPGNEFSDITFHYGADSAAGIAQRLTKDGDISGSGDLIGLAVKGGTF